MNPQQKCFLQTFMMQPVENAKEVKDLYRKIFPGLPKETSEKEKAQQMVKFIQSINSSIAPFNLELKKGICETNGTHYYCLVSLMENAFSCLSSDYSVSELEFFKILIESIVENDNGCIGSRAALNIVEKMEKKMSKREAEVLLERLSNEHWILMKDGMVFLAVRSILELNQYIQQVFPDAVRICNICKFICLNGFSCPDCGIKIHRHCSGRYYHNVDDPRCPDTDCNAPWPHRT